MTRMKCFKHLFICLSDIHISLPTENEAHFPCSICIARYSLTSVDPFASRPRQVSEQRNHLPHRLICYLLVKLPGLAKLSLELSFCIQQHVRGHREDEVFSIGFHASDPRSSRFGALPDISPDEYTSRSQSPTSAAAISAARISGSVSGEDVIVRLCLKMLDVVRPTPRSSAPWTIQNFSKKILVTIVYTCTSTALYSLGGSLFRLL